uniref:Serine/arginine repetitive matrix protein 1 n=1 Tax=Panthera tigris altaica TaxID=74533 RepID=A0A8C9KP43_PANTA
GTSAEKDSRVSNKQKKLLKQLKFAACLEKKVDMSKVNLEVIKPWVTKRVIEIRGFEDDVVIEFIFNELEVKNPVSKIMQINLTGLLNGKNAREFMGELWPQLLSARENIAGIPSASLELKKEEIKRRQIKEEKLASLKKQDEYKDKRVKEEKESSREKKGEVWKRCHRSRSGSNSPRRWPSPRRRTPPRRMPPPPRHRRECRLHPGIGGVDLQ